MSDRHREQAHSYNGPALDADLVLAANQTVGVSLLAMRPCQAISMLNVRPLSRASPLPQGSCVAPGMADSANTCGSGLARDGAMPGDIDVECPTAIASRLTPTGGLRWTDIWRPPPIKL